MRIADNWQDYCLLDTSGGERLERWGNVTLIRPDPQIIWECVSPAKEWNNPHARYIRSSSGGGHWEYSKSLPESWNIKYKDLTFTVKPTGFKHTGLFPEQAVNWDYCTDLIKSAGRPIKVLNLFAYTGGATLACAAAGASVCHLDAVKGMVDWGKTNAKLSGLADKPIRWITDDAMKFLGREIKRGNKYDGIILDPPSYGRGTNGEMWKLEDCIHELMLRCTAVLSDNPLFILLNSYTTGLSPSVMAYLLKMTVGKSYKIDVRAEEIGLPVKNTGLAIPCGNTAIVRF
ncbi:MAG: class I SAM-dependent methyltransferase [Firmicutes bacterium]|nr:class I SAM-dependent methyltransferase [[Eubacterium] siraeum]MCM1488091.1 class I SAM-dependent methyltransferase [Bacillota bacterium]